MLHIESSGLSKFPSRRQCGTLFQTSFKVINGFESKHNIFPITQKILERDAVTSEIIYIEVKIDICDYAHNVHRKLNGAGVGRDSNVSQKAMHDS